MTREEIIRMAREAAFYDGEIGRAEDSFVHFAALVAAAEREACAGVVEEEASRWAVPVTSADYREMWDECAAAIRARGQG